MTAPAHLTTAQLAERWHVTANAVRVAQSRGKAPRSIKRGNQRLYPLAEVEAWERRRMTAAQAAPHAA